MNEMNETKSTSLILEVMAIASRYGVTTCRQLLCLTASGSKPGILAAPIANIMGVKHHQTAINTCQGLEDKGMIISKKEAPGSKGYGGRLSRRYYLTAKGNEFFQTISNLNK